VELNSLAGLIQKKERRGQENLREVKIRHDKEEERARDEDVIVVLIQTHGVLVAGNDVDTDSKLVEALLCSPP